ncbi:MULTISPECIES: RNA 2'-phosphotransferase [unclassified Micromonospora]|uniref:RNA 2'-phosphotransferase n=1 Tax=unclassified Micromonospora TaxID=2617518 RepID=UPI003A83C034
MLAWPGCCTTPGTWRSPSSPPPPPNRPPQRSRKACCSPRSGWSTWPGCSGPPRPWRPRPASRSVPIDLGLVALPPPERLYHGTTAAALDSIRATGLHRARRHHVHLSADTDTARRVGARRAGGVVILTVDAAAMARDGHLFYRSANGVWLTDAVPPRYLDI